MTPGTTLVKYWTENKLLNFITFSNSYKSTTRTLEDLCVWSEAEEHPSDRQLHRPPPPPGTTTETEANPTDGGQSPNTTTTPVQNPDKKRDVLQSGSPSLLATSRFLLSRRGETSGWKQMATCKLDANLAETDELLETNQEKNVDFEERTKISSLVYCNLCKPKGLFSANGSRTKEKHI